MRPGIGGNMVWGIFVASYAVALITTFAWAMKKQAAIVRIFQRNGIPEGDIDKFRREMLPKTLLMLAWSSFFFGSLLGLVVWGAFALFR